MNQKLVTPFPNWLNLPSSYDIFWCTIKRGVDCFRPLTLRNHCIFEIFVHRIYVQTTTAMKLRSSSWLLSSGLVTFGSGQLSTSKTSAWRWSCMVVLQLVNFFKSYNMYSFNVTRDCHVGCTSVQQIFYPLGTRPWSFDHFHFDYLYIYIFVFFSVTHEKKKKRHWILVNSLAQYKRLIDEIKQN